MVRQRDAVASGFVTTAATVQLRGWPDTLFWRRRFTTPRLQLFATSCLALLRAGLAVLPSPIAAQR